MSTRHLSAEGDYPFIPPLTGDMDILSKAVLDMYVIVQGAPTGSVAPIPYPTTVLTSATSAGTDATLNFRSTFETGDYWDYSFYIPDITVEGAIEQILPTGGQVAGMLVYKSNKLDTITYPVAGGAEVEPSRVQWQTESTTDLLFRNITRCNSVEDEATLVDVLNTTELVDDVIRFEDGYNTVVSAEDGVVTFAAAAGAGKGRMPDLGNTDPGSCPEPDLDAVVEGVLVINGLLPENGDIPLSVSSGLYIEKEPGKITIKKRQAT